MANNGAAAALFSAAKLGALALRNRIVLAPMTRARAPANLCTPDMVAYYQARADAGLLITEGIHVSPAGCGWAKVPGLYSAAQVASFKPLPAAIHAKGGVIVAQLWHQGRQSHSSFHNGQMPVAPSAVPLPEASFTKDGPKAKAVETPRALTLAEIAATIQDYAAAAKNAIAAGFDGVEVHGANGYLVDQFIQASTNTRTDAYGGSRENRARFPVEVVKAVGEAIGFDKVGLRLSPVGNFGGMAGSADYIEVFDHVIHEVGKLRPAYIHLVDGLTFGAHPFVATVGRYTTAHARKQLPAGVGIIASTGYTAETGAAAIAAGDADAIAYGRPYLGNPDLVEKFRSGAELAKPPVQRYWYHSHMFGADPLVGYTKL
jgi:N-ethylmaleimide reductase